MSFWLGLVSILLIAGVFLGFPFVARRRDADQTDAAAVYEQANIAVFREQQGQYQQQLAANEITETEYNVMLAEAEALLLNNTASAQPAFQSRDGIWLLPVVWLLICASTVGLYHALGASQDQEIAERLAVQTRGVNQSGELVWDPDLLAMIAERAQARPNNIYYWTILAQEAVSRTDMLSAAGYFAEALKVNPQEGYLLAQYAQALFFVDGNRFSERAIEAMDNAYAVDSSNETVLGLKGIHAFQEGEYRLAVSYWERAMQNLAPNSASREALQSGIKQARKLSGEPAIIELTIALAISPQITYDENQFVFVAVVDADGPPMPLLARKLVASQLPLTITLTDSDGLMADRSLSDIRRVRVIARLSASGTATPQAGDWETSSEVINVASDTPPLSLTIARQRER
jgi:cytochrome c-type biogenesis protein CcmH